MNWNLKGNKTMCVATVLVKLNRAHELFEIVPEYTKVKSSIQVEEVKIFEEGFL